MASKDQGADQKFLSAVRREIDWVDDEILELLNKRARISKRVGRLKAGSGDPVFKPAREKALLDKLQGKNPGPLPADHLRSIYREIMSSSRALQRPQKIAYLGPEGTFSHLAAMEFLGQSVDYQPKGGLESVFLAVSTGEAELGVIPLENTLEGSVGQSLDLFHRFEVFIQAELYCRIVHSLLSGETELDGVTEVHSHPQPLGQCGEWLARNLPDAVLVPARSTAEAAQHVADQPGKACIGHSRLAARLGLNVLAQSIEDTPDNWTRFCVIAAAPLADGQPEKTSVLFTTTDKPGSLAGVLSALAEEGVNMSKLESRPLRGEKWKYVFFVDLECDLYAPEYKQARKKLNERCNTLRLLGSYPSGPKLDMNR
jgi:chorismate mutase/prephenate dehydratase